MKCEINFTKIKMIYNSIYVLEPWKYHLSGGLQERFRCLVPFRWGEFYGKMTKYCYSDSPHDIPEASLTSNLGNQLFTVTELAKKSQPIRSLQFAANHSCDGPWHCRQYNNLFCYLLWSYSLLLLLPTTLMFAKIFLISCHFHE